MLPIIRPVPSKWPTPGQRFNKVSTQATLSARLPSEWKWYQKDLPVKVKFWKLLMLPSILSLAPTELWLVSKSCSLQRQSQDPERANAIALYQVHLHCDSCTKKSATGWWDVKLEPPTWQRRTTPRHTKVQPHQHLGDFHRVLPAHPVGTED